MSPGSTIRMPDANANTGSHIADFLAVPGVIVMIEGGILDHFFITPECSTSGFAALCRAYDSTWAIVWNYFNIHYPFVIGFCSIMTICVVYALICSISWITNWSFFALSTYLFYNRWFPGEMLRRGHFPDESRNEATFIFIVFVTFIVVSLLIIGHAMLDTLRRERREAAGNVTLIERMTTIYR